MAIPQSVIEEIKYRSDLESVISSYISLKRRGKNLIGLCPFHGEKTPSFTLYPENGSFYCFGCKVGGDVFTFVKLIENLDYIDAVKLLAERAGIAVIENEQDDSMHKLRNTIYEINRETARFYYSNLSSPKGKWAMEYYLSRGLTQSTIKSFGLGVALDEWDSLFKHLKAKGFSAEDMLQANVITKSNKGSYFDRFRDRSMFPIINIRGNVIGFSGRRRTEDKTVAKYVNTGDTPVYNKSQNLFALNLAKSHCAEQIILVEGNFDAVALHQAGFKNTVAPLGTAFTREQAQILSRYTKEVILCFDSDLAGEAAVEKAFATLKDTGLSVKVLKIPAGKDPDEFLKNNKPSDFARLVSNAIPETEYKLIKAADGIEAESSEAKIKYLNNAVEILASNDDAIAVDFYLGKLSAEYGVSKESLVTKLSQIKKKTAAVKKKNEIKKIINRPFDKEDINPERRGNEKAVSAEELIISVIMKHPDLINWISDKISANSFITDLNKRLFTDVCALSEQNGTFSISSLQGKYNDKELGYISKLLNTGFASNNPKEILLDCAKVLKEERVMLDTDNNDDWAAQMKKIAENKKGNLYE
ncbi:MAG: DNA primase [Clostridia bacterium]|nr:DNA primase [Clostridia bacterium]